jgi:hypothetical protein
MLRGLSTRGAFYATDKQKKRSELKVNKLAFRLQCKSSRNVVEVKGVGP